MEAAPLHTDLADGPPGGRAVWLRADDGIRLRLAIWPGGDRGTVLLLPGRTEYIEKYGRAAGDLARRGYATLVLDNRGQGLSDRLAPDPLLGHVGRFADYQRDLAAVLAALPGLDLPQPLFLMAHSMGGAIGLRALVEGLPARAAVFSAPMWGILMARFMAPVARGVAAAASRLRLGLRYAPSTSPVTYLLAATFEGNSLTTDRGMWDWMRDHAGQHPELTLGGPSLHWLDAALAEGRWLARQPSPALPCLTMMGTDERIVSTAAIRHRMATWPGARLVEVPEARHEIMMEGPGVRAEFFDAACALFDANR